MYYRRPCQNTQTQKLITDVKQCEQGFYCKPTALPFKIHHFHLHYSASCLLPKSSYNHCLRFPSWVDYKTQKNWKQCLCIFFSWGGGGGGLTRSITVYVIMVNSSTDNKLKTVRSILSSPDTEKRKVLATP